MNTEEYERMKKEIE
ncbi:MAG: hypothetical protein HQ507_10785 [Candidatus Marinimicrobia bacterium]|nr:hypothetical protein [Candidatus Neomarinimicrobiota bacterium]